MCKDFSKLPKEAFIHPKGLNKQEVIELLQRGIQLFTGHLSNFEFTSPLPNSPEKVFNITIPDSPMGLDHIFDELKNIIELSMNPSHPGYIGHMDSMPTTMSIMGDMISTALNNNMLSIEMSPMLSNLESSITKAIAGLFGLGENAGGVLVSGGSLANLQALTVARNHAFKSVKQGIVGLNFKPVILASEAAHTSLQKAAMILGLGIDAVISVKTNENSQLDASDLVTKIEKCKLENKYPFCVVATAGTTVTGSIDNLIEINKIAKEYGLWFHVDVAYGGGLVLSDKYRKLIEGIEFADSITFNPQKLLYIAKTCAMVLFRDMRLLDEDFRISAPYMKEIQSVNLGEISVQGTRHADILKFWLSVQHIGKDGYNGLINKNMKLTQYFMSRIQERSDIVVANIPQTNIICFRGTPSWLTEDKWDDWNTKLQNYLLNEESIFISLPMYKNCRWLRVVLLNPYTDESVIDNLFEKIDDFIKMKCE